MLWKHKDNYHKEEDVEIKMRITKIFKDPLTRQANEAVRINQRNYLKGELLNSESEFNHPPRLQNRKSAKLGTLSQQEGGRSEGLPKCPNPYFEPDI